MSKIWRVGILGLGHWYSAYGLARALPEYPRAELVAAAWHDAAQLDEFCTTFGVEGHGDYGELLGRDDVDIVHVAAPVAEIPGCAVQAARSGKHVILGKPMAMSLDEADAVVRAVEASGIVCIPFGCIMRFRYAELKNRIDAGEIGDVLLLHQTSRWSIAEDWYRSGSPGWFVDPRHVPGGALIDEGIYWMDFFRWISGSEIQTVEARTANLVHRDIEVEDWGMATFTYENGITATLEASWTITAPRPTGPSPKQNSVVRLEVVGSEGEVIDQWFREPGRQVLRTGASDWIVERQATLPFAPPTPMPLAHLIDCVENGVEPVATVRDARAAFEAAMAAYESAREDRRVVVSSERRSR